MHRVLIQGASIVSMDDATGDLTGDLLIEGEHIAAIGAALPKAAAQVIDARGFIAIPGFVNAHMHTWQTALRGLASNWTLTEYFRRMHAGLATHFTPDDIYIATLAGALNQIDCGTTTLGDWCHNNPTPAHTDAAVNGLVESGMRAVFFHGSPKPDPRPGERPFWETPHPRAEIERLSKGPLGQGGRVGLGMAILGPHYCTLQVALHDFALAREFGLIASMHQGGGPARTPEGWSRLEQAGLLGPNVNIVHGNNLTDAQLRRFVDLGMSFSVTPENELTQGHGFPITGRLRELQAAPSLGVDLESGLSGEMFVAARIALGMQRALDNAAYRQAHGGIADTSTVTCREALSWATVEGARALGLQDRVGSLAVGKQADLVLIDARQLNMWPLHDPVNAVVMQTSLRNIDTVMIGGRLLKRGGRLLAGDARRVALALRDSGARIARAMGLPACSALTGVQP